MSKIGLSEESSDKSEMIDSIRNLVGESFNIGEISDYGYDEPKNADVAWQIGNSVKSSTTISYEGYGALMDLDNNPNPFKGMDVTRLLSKSQMELLKTNAMFPGIEYKNSGEKKGIQKMQFTSCKYYVPRTVGYYQLKNTFATCSEPFNTYMFVDDANSPTPIYDVDTSNWTDSDWSDENVKKVAGSLFMYQDSALFEGSIGDIEITGGFDRALRTATGIGTKRKIKWGDIIKWNTIWHASGKDLDLGGL